MGGIIFTPIENDYSDGIPVVSAIALQGSTWEFVLKVVDAISGIPFGLSGYSGRSQIRKNYKGSVVDEFAVTMLAPESNGEMRLRLEAASTALIKRGRYVFDVEIYTANDSDVKKVLICPALVVYPESTKVN